MFCPNCGTQNPETAATCSKCNFNLKGAAAPKFKGTMLMQQSPQVNVPKLADPAPPAAAPAAAPAAPAPMPSKLKGTMVGVAPPGIGSAPLPPPPADPGGGFPPPGGGGYGGPPPQGPPGPDPHTFGSPAGVNPLGGTMVAPDGMGQGAGGYGGPPGGGGPPPGGYGGPPGPGGFGGAPPGGPGGGGYGGPPQYGDPNAGGFGQPPPGGGYGGPPPGGPPGGGGYGGPPPGGAPGGYGGPPPQDFGGQMQQGFNQGVDAISQGINQALAPGGYQQQQPGYGGQPGGMQPMGGYPGGGPMMQAGPGVPGQHGPKGQVRNPINVLVLGLVTCGIYQMIWFISVAGEMQQYLQRDEPKWVNIMLLSIVTCGLYGLFWQITRCGALIQEMQQRAGIANAENKGWLYIVPYYNVILMQQELNRVWESPG